jgi:hypothetical protein
MSAAMATTARVLIPGVPPAWTNERGHHMALHARKDRWKQLAWTLAQSARNAAGWPPLDRVEPAPRWVAFTLHRHRLLDTDNAWASVKPLLDGLKGVLVVDDSPRWCSVVSVAQLQVPTREPEHSVIVVYLADPR